MAKTLKKASLRKPQDETQLQEGLGLSSPLVVDHSLSLEQLFRLGGWKWPDEATVFAQFPQVEAGIEYVQVENGQFDEDITSVEQAVSQLAEWRMRPATIYELLAYGIKYPKAATDYSIGALGSVFTIDPRESADPEEEVKGRLYYAYLDSHPSEGVKDRTYHLWRMSIDVFSCGDPGDRFLAVHLQLRHDASHR